MGVILKFGFQDDLKPQLNTDKDKCRFYIPSIVKIFFVDEKSGTVMFSFVPKLEDEATINEAFSLLKFYDEKRKEIFKLIKENQLK